MLYVCGGVNSSYPSVWQKHVGMAFGIVVLLATTASETQKLHGVYLRLADRAPWFTVSSMGSTRF